MMISPRARTPRTNIPNNLIPWKSSIGRASATSHACVRPRQHHERQSYVRDWPEPLARTSGREEVDRRQLGAA
eukprot:3305573-Pyramimonas_sp.AAC.1